MTISHVEYGSGSPVIILHGLFGSARNWASIAKRLAKHHHVYAVNLRNHGTSFWDDAMRYEDMAEDLHRFICRRDLRGADLVGHSMGGKAAMALALIHPNLVAKLVVVDIAPVEYEPHFSSYLKAMRALPLDQIRRRSDADDRLAVTITDRRVRAFLLQNLEITAGASSWRINLAAIDDAMEDIRGFPDFVGHRRFVGPTLFVAGSTSDYLQPSHNAVIHGLFPKATFDVIQGAGHWVHAERPDVFLSVINNFLTPRSAS